MFETIVFFSIFFLTWIILKRIFIIQYDVLLFFILHTSLVVSSVFWRIDYIESVYLWQVVLSHLALLSGIVLFWKVLPYNKIIVKRQEEDFYIYLQNNKKFSIVAFALISIVLLFYFYIAYMYGFLMFAENPELYKTNFVKGGLGFIFRFMAPMSTIVFLIFFILLDLQKKYFLKTFYSFGLVIIILSSGKSILLGIFTIFLIYQMYRSLVFGIKPSINFAKLSFIMTIILGSVLYVLYLSYGDFSLAIFFLIERITSAPGLGLTIYLEDITYFDTKVESGFFVFAWNHFVVPIFAPFRLVDYEPTLARELGRYITGGEEFGPNPTVYLEGLFYLGYFGGLVWSFFIGALISILRNVATRYALKQTFRGAIMFVFIQSAIIGLSTDFLVFIAVITSLIYFYLISFQIFGRNIFLLGSGK